MKSKLFFTFTEGISVKKIVKLKDNFGNLETVIKLDKEQLERCGFLTEADIRKMMTVKKTVDIDKQINAMMEKNIRVTFYGEENYPYRLYDIASPPWGIYYINELPADNRPVVSIIGARSCSEYGKSCARYFASELAKSNVQIVSGMASGIDGIAQSQAIVNGKSFGVLGCGVDICYPAANRDLYTELMRHGGIMSEYPLGTKPEAYRFPMRNRIISGLSDIVLVIEAKEKSGTSITVSMALEQGKDVFAVPGRINDRLSDGCNRLIKDGAGVAVTVDDILEELDEMDRCNVFANRAQIMRENIKLNSNSSSRKNTMENEYENQNLDLDTLCIIRNIAEKSMGVDELFGVCGENGLCAIKDCRSLAIRLAEMELEGLIKSRNGCYEVK